MDISINSIDKGKNFDFGKTSKEYALYRDIYPESLYDKLILFNIGQKGQDILDLGTGTGVIPRHMVKYGAGFTGADISENQIKEAISLSEGMDIKYKVCPGEETGFPDKSFDAVTACQCCHYFDTDRLVPELKRIL